MKLITEVSRNIQVKGEDENVYIEGIFSTADLMNENGRKYKYDVLDREVRKLEEKISKKCLWGELGHPPNPEINPDRISHLVEKLFWEDNNLCGRAKIVDTAMGKTAKVLIKEGNLGISSRGLGTVSESDNYVNEDFNLITWDLVTDPSNSTSWVKGIYEDKEFGVKKEEIVVPEPKLEDIQREYHRKVWQVLIDIEKNI
jgi:hypothetical protein